ncbi:MAG: TMEM175 family protein [Thermoleophilia bacterium]|jgi:uncharacterized membrane protein|nr:TMEM175 family protein [Thermoleophilia bacterium]
MSDQADMTSTSGPAPPAGASTPDGRLLPTNRLEAFSDGVFAIAITLLVLELHVPAPDEPLAAALTSEWPAYLGYFVSFAFIGGSWVAHNDLTRLIKAADAAFLRLNLLFLLFVSLLPFSTSLMATHLGDTGERLAVVLFGLNLTLAALMIDVLLGHAVRTEGLADDAVDEEELRQFEKQRRAALISQAVATAGAMLLPKVAVVAFLVVSVVFLVAPLLRAYRRRRRSSRGR